jgi:hypothetical protein
MPASIWLQLSGDAGRMLSEVIGGLAARHGTMPFQPHLTLCGFSPEDSAMGAAAGDYIRRCGLLPARVKSSGVSYSTATPFKAVVIDVENSLELAAFRAALRRIAGAPEPEPPHISLLYTIDARQNRVAWAADAARLQAIADDCAARVAATEFLLDAPVVVAPKGEWTNIASWRVVAQL